MLHISAIFNFVSILMPFVDLGKCRLLTELSFVNRIINMEVSPL
jgi:hypothetical protein